MLIRPDSKVFRQGDIVYKPAAKEWAEIESLCSLCEEGRLYEVEKWIQEGKPIQCEPPAEKPPKQQRTPLQIVVSKGFHSLAELLLVNGYNPNGDYYECLSGAVTTKNHSMAEVLLRMGANPLVVDFRTVLETYERKLMDCFVDAGVDPCAKNAVAKALQNKGRPLLGFVKTHMDRFPEMRRQASIALRSFADEDDAKGVSLMLWLDADPYLEVPSSPWEEDSEHSWTETPIETALRGGKEPIIMAMLKKPIPQNRVQDLLCAMGHNPSPEMVRRLLAMGANPNGEHNGHHLLKDYVFSVGGRFSRTLYAGRDKKAVEAIALLAEAGIKWSLDSKELANLRRSLIEGESSVVFQLIDVFKKYNVMPAEQIHELIRTPAMRSLLAGNTRPFRDPFAPKAKPVYNYSPPPEPVSPRRGHWKRHWWQR